MYIQLDPSSDIAIYEQLTRQIIEGIARGELQAGERLPSVRGLAADLGVNMHTVNKSYAELEKKGILEIKPKSGAIVRERPDEVTLEQLATIQADLQIVVAEGKVTGVSREQFLTLVQQVMADLHFE